jgi:type IV secretory pathway TraG/TraD family ATPase VirD4
MWPFGSPRPPPRKNRDETTILTLSGTDEITLGQSYESILITGGTGSGKTTSAGAHVLFNLLKAGSGMVVFTVKPDEYGRIAGMCKQLGREVIRFAPGEKWRLDVVDYSLRQKHGSIAEACELLNQLIQVAGRNRGDGNSSEPFWEMLAQRIIRMCMIGTWYGNGKCTIVNMYDFVTSLPTTREEIDSKKWFNSFSGKCMLMAAAKSELDQFTPEQKREIALAEAFMDEWVALGEKTRASGQTMVMNILSVFMGGDVSTLIASGETNITPAEIINQGKVIVIDYPILSHREPAQFMQIVLKTMFQRAALRREVERWSAPFVMFADEANWLVMPQADALTLSVGRSFKLINVCIIQNLPLLYRSFGASEGARHDANAWIGNFGTKIICANSDTTTNEFFEKLCGNSRQMFFGGSSGGDYDAVGDIVLGNLPKASGNFSEHWHPDVPAGEFPKLRKGGKGNGFLVDVIAFQNGRIWSNGKVFYPATIKQVF